MTGPGMRLEQQQQKKQSVEEQQRTCMPYAVVQA